MSKRIIICFSIILTVFGFTVFVNAQPDIIFDHITVADGLSQSTVKTIFQDSKGFMWFGTNRGGVNRYDGYEFKVYERSDETSNSIGNNTIHVFYEDEQGNIWIGTNSGLSILDRKKETITNDLIKIKDSTIVIESAVHAIVKDAYNNLWIGTGKTGLIKICLLYTSDAADE